MTKRFLLLALAALTVGIVGCGEKQITSEDIKDKDPYAGMTTDQKIEAIRNDPKISTMQKESMIADLQKGQGQPAGQ